MTEYQFEKTFCKIHLEKTDFTCSKCWKEYLDFERRVTNRRNV